MYYKFTIPLLKGFVLVAVAGLCSLTATAENFGTKHTLVSTKSSFAQVVGKVIDEEGAPLPGAAVLVKGTTTGTVSGSDGSFTIEADMGSVLVISFLGYVSQEITINSTSLEVKMEPDASMLDEFVVVGYGDQNKADVTGAVAQITSENFRQGINTSADNLIQGKIAGVRVVNSSGQPGAGMDVVIRGIGSIRSGSTPLFVVDGVPLSNDNASPTGSNIGFGSSAAQNPLNFLNTSDIESINVLKDASAAAIYGARGANGVVIITTKKGAKGKGTLTVDSYVGFSTVAKKLDLLSADAYRSSIKDSNFDHGGDTDWQDEIFRTGITNNQALSFAKQTNSGDYYVSLGHMDQEGIVGNSRFSRYSARINASESFLNDERLRIGVHLTASETRDRAVPTSDDGGSNGQLITQTLMANPTYPVFDQDGNYTNFKANAYYNPAYLLSLYDDVSNTTRILGNVETSFRIFKGLQYKFNLGIDRSLGKRDATLYPNIIDINPTGRYSQTNIESMNTLLEHYLTYNVTFNRHKLDALAGFSYQKFDRSGSTWGLAGIANQGEGVPPKYNPGYKGTLLPASGYSQENELQSYFGRVNYAFDDKYLVTASIRADGSTRFGENNKYGYFPSFAAGWNFSRENFLSSATWLSNAKLRASWGQTGNQEVQNKITQASYALSGGDGYYMYSDLNLVNGLSVTRTPNPDLKWEVSTQYDIGVDFSLLNERVYGTVDYFNKTTTDAILYIPSQLLSPTSNVWVNIDGKIVNTGVEMMLGYHIFQGDKLTWSVDVNGATLHNEVQDLPVSEIYSGVVSGTGLTDVWANIYKSGYAVGSFYLLQHEGFDENGADKFKDKDGDGAITNADRYIIEGALPNFSYGLNTQLKYGGFDLSLSFIGQSGGYLINNTAVGVVNVNNLNSDRNTTVENANSGASITNPPRLSTLYLEKSDFFRLNSARIGYTFRSPKVTWLDNATLYVTGQNVFTITDYSGFDPLINSPKALNGNQSLGIDYPRFPTARTFTVGLSIKL